MWLQGNYLIKQCGLLPEELLHAFKHYHLVPFDRIADLPMSLEEVFLLTHKDPFTLPHLQKDKDIILINSLHIAFFKKVEALEFLHSLGIRTEAFSFPEVESIIIAESLKALLLKSEQKSRKEISTELWPNEAYENGNAAYKKVGRRLKCATELIEQAIEPFQL
jgi:hypothetical protein